MRHLQYLHSFFDPIKYRRWIIREFGAALVYTDNVHTGKLYLSGICHVYHLAQMMKCSPERLLARIQAEILDALESKSSKRSS